jgi:hypothetical protein
MWRAAEWKISPVLKPLGCQQTPWNDSSNGTPWNQTAWVCTSAQCDISHFVTLCLKLLLCYMGLITATSGIDMRVKWEIKWLRIIADYYCCWVNTCQVHFAGHAICCGQLHASARDSVSFRSGKAKPCSWKEYLGDSCLRIEIKRVFLPPLILN